LVAALIRRPRLVSDSKLRRVRRRRAKTTRTRQRLAATRKLTARRPKPTNTVLENAVSLQLTSVFAGNVIYFFGKHLSASLPCFDF